MLDNGLFYTTRKPLKDLQDLECRKAPSRNYITMVLMQNGADPNI